MKQAALFDDICERNHCGHPASIAARAQTSAKAGRARVLAAIREAGVDGLCCDEIEQRLGMSHQSCSARCSELKRSGAVRERGYRHTRTGAKAAVLVAGGVCNIWSEGK